MILPVGMKVKPTIPGAVIRFPSDPQRRLSDAGDEVPETGEDSLHWHRLLRTKEITLVVPAPVAPAVRVAPAPVAAAEPLAAEPEPGEPTGREPVTPITTR